MVNAFLILFIDNIYFILLVSTFLSYSEFSTACLPFTKLHSTVSVGYCFLREMFLPERFLLKKEKELGLAVLFVFFVLFCLMLVLLLLLLHVTTADRLVTRLLISLVSLNLSAA